MVKKKKDRLKKVPKPAIGRLYGIQTQKEMKSNPKQPSCKKKQCGPQKGYGEKDVNPRWRPRNGCDGRLMVKIFNNDNLGEFFAKTKWHKNSPQLSLLKFLPLTYHHSHFLAATLDFTSFFTIAFLRAALFFLQFGCFGLDSITV